MMKNVFLILTISVFISGCISAYTGREPDFTLKGADAEAEYDRFHFDESYWFQSPLAFVMGSEYRAQPYTIESLKPMIKEVSPEAWDMYKRSKIWRQAGLIVLGSAVVFGLVAATNNDGKFMSQEEWTAYYSLLGVSIGFSFIQPYFLTKAAERYNQDLKQKFTPALGMNFNF